MIRSLLLGLTLIFFALSAFFVFKGITYPGSDSSFQYQAPDITFLPPESESRPIPAPLDTPPFLIPGDETGHALLENRPTEMAKLEESPVTTSADAETMPASRDTPVPPRTLAIFDGKTFRSGQDIIQNIEFPVIEALIKEISSSPDNRILIHGHTDNIPTGKFSNNMELSLRRARSIANILISNGIPSDRISVQGFGDTRPIDTNGTEEGRAKNRRVEIILTVKEGDN
ncbi:MAG: OmpA family protein [Nitrosomonas sp.]|nr:MAG: OmpA family protein [Nitrosomonas sp.]